MGVLQGKRLVIFGAGYVGGALADRALREGAEVIALTRNPARADALARRGVSAIVADLAASDWHERIAGGPDFVVNCVSAAAFTPEGYRHSYVGGMNSILRWARGAGRPVGTLVYTSSTGVYPQGGGARVDESAATAGVGPTGAALLEAEDLLRGAGRGEVARSFILRLAGIYGPGRHVLLDQLRAGAGVISGRAEHRLNLVHRDDVVAAILACLAAPAAGAGGVFNLSDGHPGTREEVVTWLARRLGRPVPVFDASSPSGRRGGAGVPDRLIVSERIRRELGWQPCHPSYREGYAAILRGEV